VDTASKPVPADLLNTPFTDPVMAERYLKMLNWVLSQIPDVDIEFLSVADEMDLFWGDQKEQYREWGSFFKEVKAALKTKRPDLKVGFTITLYGLTRDLAQEFQRINQESDIVLVSYYPNDDMGLKEPTVVSTDYEELVKNYPNRIIYIEQTGYPTSSFLEVPKQCNGNSFKRHSGRGINMQIGLNMSHSLGFMICLNPHLTSTPNTTARAIKISWNFCEHWVSEHTRVAERIRKVFASSKQRHKPEDGREFTVDFAVRESPRCGARLGVRAAAYRVSGRAKQNIFLSLIEKIFSGGRAKTKM